MRQKDFLDNVLPIKDKLFRVAYAMLKQSTEAEDVVQEVLTKLWMRRDKFDQSDNLKALAYTTTRNMCIDSIRKKNTRNQMELEDKASINEPLAYEHYSDVDEIIRSIIDGLPEAQKEVIYLRDYAGFGFEDIAHKMEIKITNVRMILSRARKKVREEYLKIDSHGI